MFELENNDRSRRRFLIAGGGLVAGSGLLPSGLLPAVSAQDVGLPTGSVKFRLEIEPLVQLLENTDRAVIVEKVTGVIRSGTSYRELLTALFLAGIRNVQPRPAVGFKFHSVLVVHAAHQAALGANDSQRWMPILWAIDYFKRAQGQDVSEGDWTMAAVDESKLPEGTKALSELSQAFENWDVGAADVAAAAASRVLSASQLLDVLAKYATRDFRSIGHKSIYVAGAFRLLATIGWEHSEPVIRSLVYAALNHTGEENPSKRDAEVDRAGRSNWELVKTVPGSWMRGKVDPQASVRLLDSLRTASPVEASKVAASMLADGVHPKSLYDGMFLMAAELVSQQPAIVPLHAVTTTNAIHYLYQHVASDELRLWLLMQNASFLAHFRDAANLRGNMTPQKIDQWTVDGEGGTSDSPLDATQSLEQIFKNVRNDRAKASQDALAFLRTDGAAESIIRRSRELVFLKGNDSHDYKFSSASLEDFYFIDPRWRNQYLAACTNLLRGANESTTDLARKVLAI